jgi:glycosyltransferase involved in cell wall biosynthesis
VITFLTKQLPRYGARSGYYSQIVRFANGAGASTKTISPKAGFTSRCLGKLFSMWLGCHVRDQTAAASELRFRLSWQFRRKGIFHILNTDDHLPLFDSWKNPPMNLVGTLHHPPYAWREEDLLRLKRLSLAIVLCSRDADFFAAHAPRVCFIPHGVDTEFFKPAESRSAERSLLLVGNWLRDFELAAEVIQRLSLNDPKLTFDLVVEPVCRRESCLAELENLVAVRWHHGVNDEKLLQLYQDATLLFLPLKEASANNAVVEALACGLPIITNRIGGITDYGGGSVFDLVAEPCAEAFISLVEAHLRDPQRLAETGQRCRNFAKEHLNWTRVWRMHQVAYHSMIKQ